MTKLFGDFFNRSTTSFSAKENIKCTVSGSAMEYLKGKTVPIDNEYFGIADTFALFDKMCEYEKQIENGKEVIAVIRFLS